MKKLIITLAIIALILITFVVLFSTNKKLTHPEQSTEEVSNEQSISPLPLEEGLPILVQQKRQDIYKAALSGDAQTLAAEASDTIRYSFGVNEPGGFATSLKDDKNGKIAFTLIPKLLALPYAKQGDMYVWPVVFAKAATEWTDDDIAQMKTVLTDKEIENYRKFGSYAYYRLGINEKGEWIYYLAGD